MLCPSGREKKILMLKRHRHQMKAWVEIRIRERTMVIDVGLELINRAIS